ncbi:MAG TPA: cytochrome P460, partial [Agrobacterium sp.]|nr:cytochrome P460 [Agrobacterium sp.]
MKRQIFFAVALSGAAAGFGTVYSRSADTPPELASPIYGVTLPEGYRDWKFIA